MFRDNNNKVVLLLNLLILLFCLTGCAAFTSIIQKDESEEHVLLEPDEIVAVNPDLRFDDLPVPVGFLVDLQSSYAFKNQETRVALLRYVGRQSTLNLIQFFTEQMPRYNWTLINQVEFEKIVLNFEKGRESCIVMIEPQKGKTLITISVAPR